MVAMETMHFFIVQLSLSLRTKILCISGVPMNDLAPMKICPGAGGCKVGQISSRGIKCLWLMRVDDQYENLPIQYIEDIYFFEVNTKYISSSEL